MANKKINYVKESKVRKILDENDYLVLLGERSNGKSYCVKSMVVKDCIKNDRKFIYLRRYDLDIKDNLCSRYFGDVPVSSMIENDDFDNIDVYRKDVWLSKYDDEKKKNKHIKKIGYCIPLSNDERQKSLVYADVDYIIMEEFVSKDGRYLYNECDRLQNFVSSVFRNNRKGKVILIGNTISRMCVYYREWQLNGIKKQKLGTVDKYIFKNDNGDDTRLAVYLTDSLNINTGMFFGNSAKSITKGSYEVSEQPHLPKHIKDYSVIYQFVLQHNDFMYLCKLLRDREDASIYVWYVEPKTSEIKDKTRVISNLFNPSPYYSRTLKESINDKERMIFGMFRKQKVCFADNLTGTEFNNIIQDYL